MSELSAAHRKTSGNILYSVHNIFAAGGYIRAHTCSCVLEMAQLRIIRILSQISAFSSFIDIFNLTICNLENLELMVP